MVRVRSGTCAVLAEGVMPSFPRKIVNWKWLFQIDTLNSPFIIWLSYDSAKRLAIDAFCLGSA